MFPAAQRVRALPPNFWAQMDAAIAERAAQPGPRMIDASKGNPDTPTPEHIVHAMQHEVAQPHNHRYPSYTGRPRARAAIAHRYQQDHGVIVDPDTHIALFHGSHEALMAAVLGLADPGDTVVVPDPGYPMYHSAVELAGARGVPLGLKHPEYQPDWSTVEHVDSARILLLNYPNNPTGAVARPETFTDALTFVERTGAAFIHDFAYSSLGFTGGRPLSALTVDPQFTATVEVQTLSKTYSMAGWRFGMAVGNASIIRAMRDYQAHAFSTMFGALQETAAAALDGDQTAAADLVDTYRNRRDLVVSGLQRLGWHVVPSEGTFFVWARVPGGDAMAFTEQLRDHARVALAPGDGFGERGRGFVRIGLVHDTETLTEMLHRIAEFTGNKGTITQDFDE